MRVTITASQLRLGMYICAIDTSWWEHPFWRSSFLLRRQADLDKIVASDFQRIEIDTERGLSPTPDARPAESAPDDSFVAETTPPPGEPVDEPIVAPPRPRPVRRREDAATRAAETVQKSKLAVRRMFGEARLGQAVKPADVAPLVDEIAASVARDPGAIISVCRLKNKDEYTYLHSVAVCALMINLGRHLRLDEREIRDIGMAGLLHDIGKMAMPNGLLDKPGKLDDTETRIIRTHPEEGIRLLGGDGDDLLPIARDVCLHHHERVDGTGYPFGLTADQLSVHARMGAVCDVYDAVTSNRSYKPAWSPSDALSKMMTWEGHFDPNVLSAFVGSIGIYPIGTLVQMADSQLGIVIAANADEPTLPCIRRFYAVPDSRFLSLRDAVAKPAPHGDAILRPEDGDRWFGRDWPMIAARVLANERVTGQLFGGVIPLIGVRAA